MAGFQVMPRLSADEFAALEADIVENGVRVPITVAEDGRIVDGHHRDEIARRHGLHCPRVTAVGDDGALRSLAFSLNVNRRHLSREQKRVLVAESLRADPILRDREHARRCGVNHETVGRVRAAEGIPTPDEVILAEIERSGDKDYLIAERLGVSDMTVKRVREDSQNGENRQNGNASPESESEPESGPDHPPSWEPAGHLHPADLAALNSEKKSIFLPKPTPEPRPYDDVDPADLERRSKAKSSYIPTPEELAKPTGGKKMADTMTIYESARKASQGLTEMLDSLMETTDVRNLDDIIDKLQEQLDALRAMNSRGDIDEGIQNIMEGNH